MSNTKYKPESPSKRPPEDRYFNYTVPLNNDASYQLQQLMDYVDIQNPRHVLQVIIRQVYHSLMHGDDRMLQSMAAKSDNPFYGKKGR